MKKQLAIVMLAILVFSGIPMVSANQAIASNEQNEISKMLKKIACQAEYIRSMTECDTPSSFCLIEREDIKKVDKEKISITQIPEQPAYQNMTFAFPAGDLNGDSVDDVLQHVYKYNPDTELSTCEIIALNGNNGRELWNHRFNNALAVAYPAEDLNGDGTDDVIIDVIIGIELFPSSKIIAVNGNNGAEIWSKLEPSAALAFLCGDLTGDNITELMVHVYSIDVINETIITTISPVGGSNGEELWSRRFDNAIAIAYPVGDLTSDGMDDCIVGVYRMEMAEIETEEAPVPISSEIIAIDGSDGSNLWNKTFNNSLSIAYPAGDLTGDGTIDLLIRICIFESESGNEPAIICEIMAIRGYDGIVLWIRDSDGIVPLA
jgi:outer membrane protein assembly factor BamB